MPPIREKLPGVFRGFPRTWHEPNMAERVGRLCGKYPHAGAVFGETLAKAEVKHLPHGTTAQPAMALAL